jgi:hypothetical protein
MTAGRQCPPHTGSEPADQSDIITPRAKLWLRLCRHDRRHHGSSGLMGDRHCQSPGPPLGSFLMDTARRPVTCLDQSVGVQPCVEDCMPSELSLPARSDRRPITGLGPPMSPCRRPASGSSSWDCRPVPVPVRVPDGSVGRPCHPRLRPLPHRVPRYAGPTAPCAAGDGRA